MTDDKSFTAALAIAYVMGAARAEATARGVDEKLRQEVLPLIAQFRRDGLLTPLFAAIKRVLGDDWEPQDEWADAIRKLLGEEQAGG